MESEAVTITLGDMVAHAERHLASGRFASMSEVLRAGIRALDREEAAMNDILRAQIEAAIADIRPPIAIDDAFADVRRRIAERRSA